MRKAKVLVTDLLGSNNQIFHSGDTVIEGHFPEGNFQGLLDGKFIEELTAEAEKSEEVKHKLTQEDLDNNPDLVEGGLKVDDEIVITESFKKPDTKGKKKK